MPNAAREYPGGHYVHNEARLPDMISRRGVCLQEYCRETFLLGLSVTLPKVGLVEMLPPVWILATARPRVRTDTCSI